MLVSTAILTTIGIICLLYVVNLIIRWEKLYRVLDRQIPGPPPPFGWFSGSLAHLQTTPEMVFNRLREFKRNYYPVYKLYAFHRVGVNILSPEDCELIMSNPLHNEKGQIYELLHNWLSKGLLTSTGPHWQIRRKILTPAFHFSILQQFIQVFNEEGEKLVQLLKEESKKPYTDVTPIVTMFTLKTIAETAMGTKLKFDTKKELDYKKAVYDIGKILLYRLSHAMYILNWVNIFRPGYREERKVTKILHKFTGDVIRERERNFKDIELPKEEDEVYRGKRRLAMLDLLISAKRTEGLIDDQGIQEEVDTFMFEGHDTTAMALGFTLLLLANHKAVQEQIFEEMEQVLGDVRKKPSYNDLQNLRYLERCIKEALRLYPSVHFISRTLGADMVTHSGHYLPKDTNVVMHIYDVHHNPEVYPDPEKFDPDRFLPENCQKRHPYAYLPFSAGPRNCIGQRFAMLELKAAVCHILGNFILEPIDTPESIVVVADIVLRTKDGIKVKFVPRL